ncbi:unnamed protein product [Dovyalis caffra]|uniref:F-box protein n=1 Tax=Dovyalis caffra TaxID=77055 RepID=A0AAV1S653_9ROSI|nr:unnamed protein product [Dovyalis caffra]
MRYLFLDDCISMGVLGGCFYVCDENGLWMMKENSVQESWTEFCRMIRSPMSLNQLIKYLVGGEVVVNHDNKCLKLCNPANKFWGWALPLEKDDKLWSEDCFSFPGLQNSIRTVAHASSLFLFKDNMKGNKDGQCDIKIDMVEVVSCRYCLFKHHSSIIRLGEIITVA